MALEDHLKNLPRSITEVPKPEQEFEDRKRFVNEKIFPPLLRIQKACAKSETAFYLKLPFAAQPISLRNFPQAILLAWGKSILPNALLWKYCISVLLDFDKSYIAVKIGERDFEPVLMESENFNEFYEAALERSLDAMQSFETRPQKIGLVDWRRYYHTKL